MNNMHTSLYAHQMKTDEVRPKLDAAKLYCREIIQTGLAEPPSQEHLTQEQERSQGIRLRTLTRQLNDRAAFGEQFSSSELEDLPQVEPTPI